MKLNLENIIDFLKSAKEYIFPYKKIASKFSTINSENDLRNFIQERSAHVTQTTLYGYLKTRMGHKFALMVQDEELINIRSKVIRYSTFESLERDELWRWKLFNLLFGTTLFLLIGGIRWGIRRRNTGYREAQ